MIALPNPVLSIMQMPEAFGQTISGLVIAGMLPVQVRGDRAAI
ncbi:hypothetical protein [Defluviimonas sp. SAOS-178_SWC]